MPWVWLRVIMTWWVQILVGLNRAWWWIIKGTGLLWSQDCFVGEGLDQAISKWLCSFHFAPGLEVG